MKTGGASRQGQAVAGPETGRQLESIPTELTTWTDWKERHPEAIRQYRQEERRDKAERKQYRAAERRLARRRKVSA